MENRFNLVSKLSLNEMAIRRVVINLWSESDISAALDRPSRCHTEFRWDIVVEEVKEKISKLMLPKTLKKRMIYIVKPVRNEIINWILFHENLFHYIFFPVPINPDLGIFPVRFKLDIFKQLCWSCIGTIDYRKTAEELVRLEMLDIHKLYRLACWYCLEDYIPVLWAELHEESKSRFNDTPHHLIRKWDRLEYYWASVLKGEEFKLNDFLPKEDLQVSSTNLSNFVYSARRGSKAATEYFFQKLTDEERDDAFRRQIVSTCDVHFYEKNNSDVLFYLLSVMNHEQQMEFVKKYPVGCLMCFLSWPLQDLFLGIADFVCNFLTECNYDYVLERLYSSMFMSRKSYYLPDLFQKFFIHNSINLGRYFIEQDRSRCRIGMIGISFLCKFIRAKDAETIRVVFRNLDSSVRIRFLSSWGFTDLLYSLMSTEQWYLVELCVREATVSKEDREVLRDIFIRFPKTDWSDKQKRFLELLNGTSLSANITKCLDDESPTIAKRLSSEEESCSSIKKLKR